MMMKGMKQGVEEDVRFLCLGAERLGWMRGWCRWAAWAWGGLRCAVVGAVLCEK